MNWRQLGHAVRISRDDLGINQEDLASRIGVSPTSLRNIEKGKPVRLDAEKWVALADHLGVTVSYLFQITEDPLPPGESLPALKEADILYDVRNPATRSRLQEIVTIFAHLEERDQQALLAIAETYHELNTPRIIGDE